MKTGLLEITVMSLILASPVFGQTGVSPDRSTPATSMTAEPGRPMPGAGAGVGAGAGAGAGGVTAPGGSRVTEFQAEKVKLESVLTGAAQREDYATLLEKGGYHISSVNADKPELLEYEVVKDDKSYEIRLRFDEGAPVAKRIDITGNLWKAKETKEMLKQSKTQDSPAESPAPKADKPH